MLATSLEQAGAKDLLLAKTLGVVRPIRARLDGMLPDISLASLLTSSADVGEFCALFEGMFVVALLFTVFFIPVYTYIFLSVEDGGNTVDIGLGLAGSAVAAVRARGRTLAALVARSECRQPSEQLLRPGLVQKGLYPCPIIPVKTLVLPPLKKSIINSQDTFQVQSMKHRSDGNEILQLVG